MKKEKKTITAVTYTLGWGGIPIFGVFAGDVITFDHNGQIRVYAEKKDAKRAVKYMTKADKYWKIIRKFTIKKVSIF